jgi:uncharacterized membrane protein
VDIRFIARSGIYAAAYAGLTLVPGLNSLAYGQVQFRVSEGLLPLATVDPAAVAGFTLGTAIANIASPMGLVDVVYGSLLTLLATLIMFRVGPRMRALAAPVVINGIGVPVELALVLHLPYWLSVLAVTAGEAAVMLTVGMIVLRLVRSGVLWPRGRPHVRG